MEPINQMDHWQDFIRISEEIKSNKGPVELARRMALQISDLRSLMGSSKKYESATEIDAKLCDAALSMARIGFQGMELKPYLESALYYSSYFPSFFNAEILRLELEQIESLR